LAIYPQFTALVFCVIERVTSQIFHMQLKSMLVSSAYILYLLFLANAKGRVSYFP